MWLCYSAALKPHVGRRKSFEVQRREVIEVRQRREVVCRETSNELRVCKKGEMPSYALNQFIDLDEVLCKVNRV